MPERRVAALTAPDSHGDQLLLFDCPGCGMAHGPRVVGHVPGSSWTWNGNVVRPTLTPSILVRWDLRGEPKVCHSFVTDGQIQFLNDCTHSLAGQTVPLPPWDDEEDLVATETKLPWLDTINAGLGQVNVALPLLTFAAQQLFNLFRRQNPDLTPEQFIEYLRSESKTVQGFSEEWLSAHGYTKDDAGNWAPPAQPEG